MSRITSFDGWKDVIHIGFGLMAFDYFCCFVDDDKHSSVKDSICCITSRETSLGVVMRCFNFSLNELKALRFSMRNFRPKSCE
ncbi:MULTISPECIES: hypothetical protein [Bacteroides]|uniref:hypothetical protein n=1 Tax=Bacteroides TaxID=816 RepID=UPI00159EC801|nr:MULTISPECIES: hypothetical protein [Bacteroides]MBS5204303.1 hypothetical protein [Bacteroides ovatus]MCE8979287.1 hypothetical protein [Bacteroides ovatus]MCE9175606.1 hypothetical protein [Bacteroides ovatus]MCE9215603.1 hypothetical protein [Bacteroides ovatus]MDC2358881.1 hypothetical protein [Bacteroides ovatus]